MPAPRPRFKLWFVVLALISLVLIVGIIYIIYRSTVAMNWSASSSGVSGGVTTMIAPGSPPMAISEGIAMKDSAANSEIMPVPPVPTEGAGPADRNAVSQKIIKQGALTLRVQDSDSAMEQIKAITTDKGGYVSETRVSEYNGEKTAYITIRVPSNKFDETVTAVKKVAATVLEESSNSEDVTAQYIDLQARLTAAKAEEAQYLEILKRATKVEDILQVTQYLSNVRTQIEQIQGQLRYLSERTDYSTLTITLVQETKVQAPTPTWKPAETFKQALRALVLGLQALVDVAIVAIVIVVGLLLPVVLVIALIVWLLRKLWRRWFSSRR